MRSQITRTFGWVALSCAIVALAAPASAGPRSLQVAQTTDEIIKALDFPADSGAADGVRRKGKTRGISVEALPSMDFRVEFEFGSATLTPEAMRVLDKVGAALISDRLTPYRFSIVGHTDAVGSDAFNLELSRQRAQAVRDYLVGHFGISGDRLATSGLGESDLLDPSHPDSGANRRVEVTNLGS